MWQNFDGRPYSREQFVQLVNSIPPARLRWCKFITVHNTAGPTIKQWLSSVATPQQRIINLESYYEHTMGWHAGPHGFIPPSADVCIYGFTNFDVQGVHASCFNRMSIGLEMVGDFDTEEFQSGPGALVRDNAVFVLAVLHLKMGLRPDGYKLGESGLHFHCECARDNHACPGRKVSKPWLVDAVLRKMDELRNPLPAKPAPAPPEARPPAEPSPAPAAPVETEWHTVTMTEFAEDGREPSAYGGVVDPHAPGVALPFRFKGERRDVIVHYVPTNTFIRCAVVDVGPIFTNDPYWEHDAPPMAETQGIKSRAGIDATPAVWEKLGITRGSPARGKCIVQWRFAP